MSTALDFAPFSVSGSTPSRSRRLLLISYHFPPGQATGALRWQKLIGAAADRDWHFDVITLHPDSLTSPDFTRLSELPASTRIFGIKAPAPSPNRVGALGSMVKRFVRKPAKAPPGRSGRVAVAPEVLMKKEIRWSLLRPRGWLRAYRAWQVFREEGRWGQAALPLALELAGENRYDAVVSCGPPHMPHLVARAVSRATGIPMVMDMRDPWSLAPGVYADEASPAWYLIARRLESRCVRSAALVVTNTEPHRLELARAYPAAAGKIISVLNGCDEDLRPRARFARRFAIAYAGNIYIDRDPRPFFRAVANVVREESLTPALFGIDFIGNADQFAGASVLALAEAEGLAGFVSVHSRRPRAEALEFLERAPMLLSLPQGVDIATPSKIFEYMQFDAWILALAKRGTATEMLLRDSAANVLHPKDVTGITSVIRECYRAFRKGIRPTRVNSDGQFDRRLQADILFHHIEEKMNRSPASAAGVRI